MGWVRPVGDPVGADDVSISFVGEGRSLMGQAILFDILEEHLEEADFLLAPASVCSDQSGLDH